MGIVNKLFTSFSGLYNNINVLTFSGVNDVIVVKDKNGDLQCSDFQLRFGKLYFPNMSTQTVHLIVNGHIINDISMFITSQGELFFEKQDTDDSEIEYDDILGYINRLNKIKEEEMDDFLKIHFERLNICRKDSDKNKLLEFKTKEYIEMYRKYRMNNFEKRTFAIRYITIVKDDFYAKFGQKFVKFGNMLTNPDYYDWLINKYRQILLIINGLFLYPPNNAVNKNCTENGCCGATLSFSLCNDKKVEHSLHKTFMSYVVKEIKDEKNIVVKVEGCKNCKYLFYFPYALFAKIFFELRGTSAIKSKKLIEALENEHNRVIGWSFFKKKKVLKRDVSYSLKLNNKELKSLNLKPGKNTIVFKVGGVDKKLEGNIYLWNYDDKIVISDIDGTITKSDIWGHIYSMMGKDWTHGGVAGLFTKISKNGYKIMYLTARPLQQSFATKHYLRSINQEGYKLPDGPVILSPDGVFAALYREIIIKRPEDFKIACLTNLGKIFGKKNPFVSGFGNRITDVITYKAMKIPPTRIFTINSKGELYAEFANSLSKTYKSMNDFVDKIFPYYVKGKRPFIDHRFLDMKWWSLS